MNDGTINLLLMAFFFIFLPIICFFMIRGMLRWIGRQLGTRKDRD